MRIDADELEKRDEEQQADALGRAQDEGDDRGFGDPTGRNREGFRRQTAKSAHQPDASVVQRTQSITAATCGYICLMGDTRRFEDVRI